ncbi:MAG TPA: tetratricopeptide repeat protein [Ignavibacteriaceae bacterium]|nr:tetratricopeptide repeat protein [Ignavibacteriaceae bacterium]
MPKFCGDCGFEFDRNYKFCPECGFKLSESTSQSESVVKSKSTKTAPVEENKQLDPKVIFGIFGGGAIIILIIILTTGVFDSPGVSTSSIPPQTGSGVNLGNVQLINELEEKIKINPEDHKTLLDLAHLKNDSGLYEQAIINYKAYLELHPDDADARIDMGVCYFNLKDFESAKKEMLKALDYSPQHQIGHLNLGVVALSSGNLADSKVWFQKAIDIDPATDVAKRAEELLKSH